MKRWREYVGAAVAFRGGVIQGGPIMKNENEIYEMLATVSGDITRVAEEYAASRGREECLLAKLDHQRGVRRALLWVLGQADGPSEY